MLRERTAVEHGPARRRGQQAVPRRNGGTDIDTRPRGIAPSPRIHGGWDRANARCRCVGMAPVASADCLDRTTQQDANANQGQVTFHRDSFQAFLRPGLQLVAGGPGDITRHSSRRTVVKRGKPGRFPLPGKSAALDMWLEGEKRTRPGPRGEGPASMHAGNGASKAGIGQ
jgi:hypothetical protein